jgi:hypothetical protein
VDEENRGRYDRGRLRYPSDLTDEEWALVEPLIAPAKRGSNKRTVDVREVVNGLLYVLSSGCQASDPEGPAPRAARCTTILTCGRGTARTIADNTSSMYNAWVGHSPSTSRGSGSPWLLQPLLHIRGQVVIGRLRVGKERRAEWAAIAHRHFAR